MDCDSRVCYRLRPERDACGDYRKNLGQFEPDREIERVKLQFKAKHLRKLLVIGALACAMPMNVAAERPGNSTVGLFEGVLGSHDEPFAIQFDPSGNMRLISQLEEIEQESSGIGMWNYKGSDEFEFGYISYRLGSSWLCTRFDTSAVPADCTIVVTGTYMVDTSDVLTGSITIFVKQRSDGEEDYLINQIPIYAEKVSIEDLQSQHQ
jgi:hypothetical protein